ncbi:MAG: SHOCT-like domain-containing protein [Archangium sp.]
MSSKLNVIPLEFADRPSVELRATAEHIHVVPVEAGGSPRIEVETRRGESPRIQVERSGETLVVKSEAGVSQWMFGFVPFKRITMFVPSTARARIKQDFGNLKVERLEGCDLELSSSAGTISLEHIRGRMAVSVDAGTVKGEHLAGTFDIRTEAGSVKLGIDALDAGEHHVRTELGAVKLYLARGLSVKFESSTSLGSSRISYDDSKDARSTMYLSAELGSIRVKEGAEFVDEKHGDWVDWRKLWKDAVTEVSTVVNEVMPRPTRVPDEELRKVLELVQDGKISASDAERLIRAMGR